MSVRERTMLFGEGKSLVGVFTEPEGGTVPGRPALVLLNAGVLHRVGPNRLHVRLARSLAEAGLSTLRFDQSGLGDSPPRPSGLPFVRAMVDEVRQAMDALATTRGITSFVLGGICSGADNSLRAAAEDERVVGALLIEAYTVPSRAFTAYSYRHKLFSPRSWWRLLRGQSELVSSTRPRATTSAGDPTPPHVPAAVESVLPSPEALVTSVRRLVDRGVRLCLVYAETSSAYFNYRVLLRRPLRRARPGQVRVEVLDRTDHAFTPLDVQQRFVDAISDWCSGLPGA